MLSKWSGSLSRPEVLECHSMGLGAYPQDLRDYPEPGGLPRGVERPSRKFSEGLVRESGDCRRLSKGHWRRGRETKKCKNIETSTQIPMCGAIGHQPSKAAIQKEKFDLN